MNIGEVIAKFQADVSGFQKGIAVVQRGLQSIQSATKTMATGAINGFKSVGSAVTGYFGKAVNNMKSLLPGVVAGVSLLGTGALAVGNNLLTFTGNLQQTELALKTLLGSTEEARSAMEKFKLDAATTPFDFAGIARANQMLISTGIGVDDSRKAVLALGNAIVATGGGNEEFNRMVVNLQQIKNVGKAAAVDIKQFGYAGINVYEMLAKSTGKSVAELQDMDITYDMLVASLEKAAGEGGMFANALRDQGNSWNLLKSNISDVINIMGSDILTGTGIFQYLNEQLRRLTEYLTNNRDNIVAFFLGIKDAITQFAQTEGFQTFLGIMQQFGAWVMENKDAILAFLIGFGAALAGLAIAATIAAAIALITNPIFVIAAAVGLLYTAWTQNWGGIRDITMQVITYLTELFYKYKDDFIYIWEGIKTFILAFIENVKEWWSIWGNFIVTTATVAIQTLWAIISNGINIILNIIKLFIAVFQGDWGKAWEAAKSIAQSRWNIIAAIFNGMASVVSAALSAVYNQVVSWLKKAWESAKEYANKIREAISNAFNVNKRNSPSIMDRLHSIVNAANTVLPQIQIPNYSAQIAQAFAGLSPDLTGANGINGGARNVTQNNYVTINDNMDFQTWNERMAYNLRNA